MGKKWNIPLEMGKGEMTIKKIGAHWKKKRGKSPTDPGEKTPKSAKSAHWNQFMEKNPAKKNASPKRQSFTGIKKKRSTVNKKTGDFRKGAKIKRKRRTKKENPPLEVVAGTSSVTKKNQQRNDIVFRRCIKLEPSLPKTTKESEKTFPSLEGENN